MARRLEHNLVRRRYFREQKQRFIIFCEGEKTEPTYFHALRVFCSNALIAIETIPRVGVPFTIAQSAVCCAQSLGLIDRKRKNLDSFEERDEVWAVFDRDIHPNFNQAVRLCEENRVGVGRSNPCFEIWLILHIEDYNKPDDRHAIQAHLKKLRPEYDWKGAKTPDCSDLIKRVEIAERRAETLLRRRSEERNPYGRPSTTVGRLTRAIRDAAKGERRR